MMELIGLLSHQAHHIMEDFFGVQYLQPKAVVAIASVARGNKWAMALKLLYRDYILTTVLSTFPREATARTKKQRWTT